MNATVQVRNGRMKTHRMKSSLFRVWNQSFQVLQCTGDLRLTVPLPDRNIDEKFDFPHTVTEIQFHSPTFLLVRTILLRVPKFHTIPLTQTPITTDFQRVTSPISNPGTFQNYHSLKTILLKILQNPCDDFRVGSRSVRSLTRRNQIRLNTHQSILGWYQFRQL